MNICLDNYVDVYVVWGWMKIFIVLGFLEWVEE